VKRTSMEGGPAEPAISPQVTFIFSAARFFVPESVTRRTT
jgi:hypothetical protein